MTPSQIAILRSSAAQCFYGIIALTLVTLPCLPPAKGRPRNDSLYLFGCDRAAAYFAPPASSFAIDLPEDIALVIAFFLTGLTVTGLVRRARTMVSTGLCRMRVWCRNC